MVAPWWTIRPRDEGHGYNGYHLSVAGNGLPHPEHFTATDLDDVVSMGIEFCRKTWPERFDRLPGAPKSSVKMPGTIAPPRKRTVKRT